MFANYFDISSSYVYWINRNISSFHNLVFYKTISNNLEYIIHLIYGVLVRKYSIKFKSSRRYFNKNTCIFETSNCTTIYRWLAYALKKISKLDDEEHIILNDLWVWAGVFSCIIYPNKKADYYSIWKRMYRINSTYAAKRWIARSYSIKSKRFQIKSLLALFRPWERTRILEFLPINKHKTSFAHEYF